MASGKKSTGDPVDSVSGHALSLPEAEEGTSCNKISFKAGERALAYLQIEDDAWNVMLKLGDSLPEA